KTLCRYRRERYLAKIIVLNLAVRSRSLRPHRKQGPAARFHQSAFGNARVRCTAVEQRSPRIRRPRAFDGRQHRSLGLNDPSGRNLIAETERSIAVDAALESARIDMAFRRIGFQLGQAMRRDRRAFTRLSVRRY